VGGLSFRWSDHNPQWSAPEALVEMLDRNRVSLTNNSKTMFVHTVYFWLKDELTNEEKSQFLKGLNSLTAIETVHQGYVGVPASTDREIIDRSYSYALTLVFPDKAAHDAYQIHPIHDKFRDSCSRFWKRVQIYDSVGE
jgi:hypothetical protein